MATEERSRQISLAQVITFCTIKARLAQKQIEREGNNLIKMKGGPKEEVGD